MFKASSGPTLPGPFFLLLLGLCSAWFGDTVGTKIRKVTEEGWDGKTWAFIGVACLFLGLMCWVVKLVGMALASRPDPESDAEWGRSLDFWLAAYWKVLGLTTWPIVFSVIPGWLPADQWLSGLSILVAGWLIWGVACWRLVKQANRVRWPGRYPRSQ